MALFVQIVVLATALIASECMVVPMQHGLMEMMHGMHGMHGMYGMGMHNMMNPMYMMYNMQHMYPGMMGFKEDEESQKLPAEVEQAFQEGRVPEGWEPVPEGWTPPDGYKLPERAYDLLNRNRSPDNGFFHGMGNLAKIPVAAMGAIGEAASDISKDILNSDGGSLPFGNFGNFGNV